MALARPGHAVQPASNQANLVNFSLHRNVCPNKLKQKVGGRRAPGAAAAPATVLPLKHESYRSTNR
jgi:hypothetical protein